VEKFNFDLTFARLLTTKDVEEVCGESLDDLVSAFFRLLSVLGLLTILPVFLRPFCFTLDLTSLTKIWFLLLLVLVFLLF
jgi:hypothetical protein